MASPWGDAFGYSWASSWGASAVTPPSNRSWGDSWGDSWGQSWGSETTAPSDANGSLGGRKPKPKIRRLRIQEYDVPIPSELVKSATPSDTVAEPVARPAVLLPAQPLASKLAKRPAKKRPTAGKVLEPVAVVAAPVVTPVPTQPVATVHPSVAAADAPRPMLLSDILSAETMTPQEMLAALKLLARVQLGPQLIRTTPKARLIREPG